MTGYARAEREQLADLLRELGPEAPTLCGDWTTADLAAHLVVRDRRPDSGPGLLVPALADWTESVRRAALGSDSYLELVDKVARPPWWSPVSNPLLHEPVNLMEYFIHHEDVRRAQPDRQPRELPTEMAQALWRRLSALRIMLRKVPAAVTLVAPGHGELSAGRGGDARVRITGDPGELLLFCSGRQPVARVELEGPDEIVRRLRSASFSL
ncbi:MAG TPA: TIGR03085 family metal-binding protein [Micromonosporaceae bacterium]